MPIKTKPFDPAKHFATDDDQLELIADALDSGHAGYIAAALGTVAKARGMTKVATDAGLNRQALYAALNEGGNPTLDTVVKVLDVLGLKLQVRAKEPEMA
jgi:probable addiction module antidote protein